MILVVAAAALLLAGLWWAIGGGSGGEDGPLENVAARWSFTPSWGETPSPAAVLPGNGRLDVYVDSSLPMGGFLAREGAENPSAFETVLRGAQDQLLQIDDGASSPVVFFGVAENLQKVAAHRPLEKGFYRGGQSRLDLALAEIERTLGSGETEAALVLTDLIATGDVIGAQGAAQKLRGFMSSAEVLSGSVHLGLLGVKGGYRGVRAAGCTAPAGSGCRFSEQRKKWLPLGEQAVTPFYVLVFARGREKVQRVLARFEKELGELEVETESEILSAASEARNPEPAVCSIAAKADPGRPQFALFSDRKGLFRCARSEVLVIACPLPPEPRPLKVEPGRAEEWLEYSPAGEALELELDCGGIRGRDFPLGLEFDAPGAGGAAEKWSAWTSTSDDRPEDAGRTLRLEEFLQKVRLVPGAYRVVLELAPGSAE